MDLEARSEQANVKAMLLAKLREYKMDLNNLKSELKRISSSNANYKARDDLLESGMADKAMVSIRAFCILPLSYWTLFHFISCTESYYD